MVAMETSELIPFFIISHKLHTTVGDSLMIVGVKNY